MTKNANTVSLRGAGFASRVCTQHVFATFIAGLPWETGAEMCSPKLQRKQGILRWREEIFHVEATWAVCTQITNTL
jgi:hypothetical protein